MKKIFICIIFIIYTGLIFSQDNNKDNSGYNTFFRENIGKEIIINLANVDIEITGVLTEVFDDGVIIKTYFNKIFILKSAIGFAKLKNFEKSSK